VIGTFTIEDCPLCHQQHTYAVEVERSIINKVADVQTTIDIPGFQTHLRFFTCPVTDEVFEDEVPDRHTTVIGVIVDELDDIPRRTRTARALTPHSKALYEAGKTLLVDSIDVGREFCKFMVGTCSGAVPVYLGLLKFLLPEHYVLSHVQGLLLAAPAILFLTGATVFAVGYFPRNGRLSLELPAEIERERSDAINRRREWATMGFVVFALASLAAVAGSVWAITLPGPSLPAGGA